MNAKSTSVFVVTALAAFWAMLALVHPASSRGQAPTSASEVFRSFDRVLLLEEKGEASTGVYGLAFADFNGDGWPDIVAARSGAPNALWFSTEPIPSPIADRRARHWLVFNCPVTQPS